MGHAPRPAPGRPGLRAGEAGAAQRDSRSLGVRSDRLRLTGARLRQQRDPGALRHTRAQGALPRAAAGQPHHLLFLDDRAAGRRRPEGVSHHRGARRRSLGHQRGEVVLVVRLHGVLHHRDGDDRPRGAAVRALLDVRRSRRHPGINVLRDVGLGYQPTGGGREGYVRYENVRVPADHMLGPRGGRSSSRRPGWAVGAFTTRCARWGWSAGSST